MQPLSFGSQETGVFILTSRSRIMRMISQMRWKFFANGL
jgi:hypothetical protein